MAEPLKIRKVEPTATHRTPAFVDRSDGTGGLELFDFHVYPPSPQGAMLREARHEAGLTLGQAARAAGLRVSEWSGLELGGYVAEDWVAAFAVLKGARRG